MLFRSVKQALKYDIDAVYYGDDWGMQRGLQMGPVMWHKFIYPVLKRMYGVVREADVHLLPDRTRGADAGEPRAG